MKLFVALLRLCCVFVPLLVGMQADIHPTSAARGGSVTLLGYSCPAGYDGTAASLDDLYAHCLTPLANLPVNVTENGGNSSDITLDVNGTRMLGNVATGALTLSATAPAGTTLRVFCSITPGSSGQEPTPTEPPAATPIPSGLDQEATDDTPAVNEPAEGSEATTTPGTDAPQSGILREVRIPTEYTNPTQLQVAGGDSSTCFYFAFGTTTSPATLKLSVLTCPEGTTPSIGKIAKASDEPECAPQANVSFTLASTGNEIKPATKTTDADGRALWDLLPPARYTLTETPPTGTYQPVVYCIIGRIEDQPGSNQIEVSDPYSSPAIAFELNSGETADCTWFNVMQPPATPTAPNTGNGGGNRGNTPTPVAAGPASLTLTLYDCPATYDPLSTNANPYADCRQSNESIAGFTLAGETGAPQSQSPDGSNRVEFGTLDAGQYLLSAHFSDDSAAAFIGSCSSNAWNTGDYNFTPFAGIAADGRTGIQLKPGEHLDCAWYTIPGASTSTAAITLTVLTCPGQSVAASECEPGEAGTTFHLTPVGDHGSGLSLTTNGNGTARGNIEPGMYELEQLGANWCAADSAAFGSNGTLTVAGDDIDVTIYNCAG